jgi:hypothetical protein
MFWRGRNDSALAQDLGVGIATDFATINATGKAASGKRQAHFGGV